MGGWLVFVNNKDWQGQSKKSELRSRLFKNCHELIGKDTDR